MIFAVMRICAARAPRTQRFFRMSVFGHEERFPLTRLSAGFSIAANVKPRLDHLIPPPSWARLTCHTGLSLLFEVGVRPPHDGMRRMERPNLSGAVAADERQDQRALRTHPTRRPREDIFLPRQNALISLTAVFPAFSAAALEADRK